MFLSTRVCFRMRDEKTFLLPRGTQKEPFGWLFSSFSSLFSRNKASLFFSGAHAQSKLEHKKRSRRSDDDDTRVCISQRQKGHFPLSLSLFARRKRLALFSFCSFFVILIRGRVFCESVMIRKKTNRKVFAQVCNLGFFVFCLRADAWKLNFFQHSNSHAGISISSHHHHHRLSDSASHLNDEKKKKKKTYRSFCDIQLKR